MADAVALIRAAKLPERTVSLCLRGDLVAEHEELCARLDAAERKPKDSLAGNPEPAELSKQIIALQELMAESTVPFRLRALPRRQWAGLVAKHPPRKDAGGRIVDSDTAGVNVDEFMADVLRQCIVDPVLGDLDWDLLIDESLTDAQYTQLTEAAWSLNRREVDVPFSHAASRILRASAPE